MRYTPFFWIFLMSFQAQGEFFSHFLDLTEEIKPTPVSQEYSKYQSYRWKKCLKLRHEKKHSKEAFINNREFAIANLTNKDPQKKHESIIVLGCIRYASSSIYSLLKTILLDKNEPPFTRISSAWALNNMPLGDIEFDDLLLNLWVDDNNPILRSGLIDILIYTDLNFVAWGDILLDVVLSQDETSPLLKGRSSHALGYIVALLKQKHRLQDDVGILPKEKELMEEIYIVLMNLLLSEDVDSYVALQSSFGLKRAIIEDPQKIRSLKQAFEKGGEKRRILISRALYYTPIKDIEFKFLLIRYSIP